MSKINITIEMFFEIKNAEMYGGEGSTGYAENKGRCVLRKHERI